MAKVKSPFAVKGKLGNLEFYMRDGKNYIRPARFLRPLPPDYYHIFIGQKRNRFGFAGAVAACSKIYSRLDNGPRVVMRPNAYNLIRGRLRQMLRFAPVEWRIDYPVVHHALHQLDLAPEFGPSSILHTTMIGPSHRPTHIHLGNLRELANSITNRANIHGNADLQLRILLQWIPFRPYHFNHSTNEWLGGSDHFDHDFDATSQWMPAHLLPEEGLTISARPQDPLLEDVAYIICLTLQWREYRPVGPHLIHHPAQGTARLLSGQYAPDDEEAIQLITTRQQKLAEAEIPNTDCATDLSQALEGML